MAELREALEQATQTPAKPKFEEAELARVESRLAASVGPIAKTLVANAAVQHSSLAALCRDLAAQLPREEDRVEFLRAFGLVSASPPVLPPPLPSAARQAAVPSSGSQSVAPLDELTLEAARRALAAYLGPMASLVVKKAARGVQTKEQLKAALAAEIPDERARRAFLESF
jgi:serine/threonine-protein kinase